MTVRVQFVTAALNEATVHVRPSWLVRLLGAQERDYLVVACAGLSGGLDWYDDGARRMVTDRSVLDMLHRERSRLYREATQQRLEQLCDGELSICERLRTEFGLDV